MIVRNTQTGKVTRSQTLPDFPFSVLHNGAWMTPTRIGVINGEKGEEDFLASLGIHVRYVPPKGDEYFVILDDAAHAKLDPHWMTRFIWSLETIGETPMQWIVFGFTPDEYHKQIIDTVTASSEWEALDMVKPTHPDLQDIQAIEKPSDPLELRLLLR